MVQGTLNVEDRSLAVTASMRRLPLSTTKSASVLRGIAQGGLPSCGGSRRIGGVGGTHPPRLSPGGNGKGDPRFPSWLPQAVSFALRSSPFPFATAGSPCFHSHSLWSCSLRCRLGVHNLYRVLPSRYRTELS